jgi:hypothetical protein
MIYQKFFQQQKWALSFNFIAFFLLFLMVTPAVAGKEPDFPPSYIYKLSPGDDFTPFSFIDLDGHQHTNKPFLTKPVLFICGSFKLRHDVRQWAEHLTFYYGELADIIWLFNPAGTEFADHIGRAVKALTGIRPALPTVIDNHSLVGRSLKIDYRIPVLVGITLDNRLAFTLSSPLNLQAKEEIHGLIYSRLLSNSR